jgi:hypothetical protein
MPPSDLQSPQKRSQPTKNASKEDKAKEYVNKKREQRQVHAAAERNI